MPRGGANRASVAVKRRSYFQLIRQGLRGAAAARQVGVSTSCGSLWFIDAGGVMIHDPGPVSARFLDHLKSSTILTLVVNSHLMRRG
jgi:hypothetical protein